MIANAMGTSVLLQINTIEPRLSPQNISVLLNGISQSVYFFNSMIKSLQFWDFTFSSDRQLWSTVFTPQMLIALINNFKITKPTEHLYKYIFSGGIIKLFPHLRKNAMLYEFHILCFSCVSALLSVSVRVYL